MGIRANDFMKEPKETFKNLRKALANKHEQVHHPERYRVRQLRKERKRLGLCTLCGIKKITKAQKERGLINCYKCRKIEREREVKNEHKKRNKVSRLRKTKD